MTEFRTFWGKASPAADASAPTHPIVAHALDVAAVAILIGELGLDGRTLGWLISLHDIGKFSRSFQAKVPAHWPASALGAHDPANPPPPGPRHDALALHILQDCLPVIVQNVLPPSAAGQRGWLPGDRGRVFRALAGHHGRPVRLEEPSARAFCPACQAAAMAFAEAMTEVFDPRPLPAMNARALVRLEWSLAGLTTLSDWIGSRQAWFPYAGLDAVADPAAYLWQHALPRAAAAVAAAGLMPARPAPFGGLKRLFPGRTPTPLQRWTEDVPLPQGPVLVVIEDMTGSGKTEAALTLSHRLMASGQATGLFLALPTMATANAMFGRMADAYHRLFVHEARPSLALVHGRAALDPRFATVLLELEGTRSLQQVASTDPADEPGEFHCAAWLAEDRRRALLAQVGVGTIDQAIMAVLPVRHATLRLQGLRGKVLIVDEAHAFDPYMQRELVELLQFHAALGGSAILLSATLSRETRQGLVSSYRKGLGAAAVSLSSQAYPLATLTGATGPVIEQFCAPRPGLSRRVGVIRLPDIASVQERVVAAARSGAAVAWVRNTVDDVLAAAASLRAEGIDPVVFHARFALCDRLTIEAEVLRRWGPDGAASTRPGVLVGSQVIEMSLDLDLDLICTDLAPVDRLIQRAGRLWRHQRCRRTVAVPELLVLSPDPVSAPGSGWIRDLLPGTAAVYPDPALLWRSARAIFARPELATPEDMRRLIEEVADISAPGAVPPGLMAASNKAGGKDAAAAGIAGQNVLRFSDGYRPDAGSWEPDTHTPTRLEDRPQVTLRLALLQHGQIVPYAAEPDRRRAWSLSEVSVAKHRIAACPITPDLRLAAERARAEWGAWERDSDTVLLALLAPDQDGFTLTARAEDGSPFEVRYTPQEGLCFQTGSQRDEP